jgi:hypothetical protein
MSRRKRRGRWDPPTPGGTRPTEPLEIIELYPNPLPPPPRFDRAAALAGLQTAFALLTDDELRIARVRMLGVPLVDIAETFHLGQDEVEKLWKQARRKLYHALFSEPEDTPRQDQQGE